MKILKIETTSRKERLKVKKIEMPVFEILNSLYNNDGKSLSDIAVMFNTSTMTVLSWMRKYKIQTRLSNMSVYHELRESQFSQPQVDLIIGSILGDGSLRIPKHGKNAIFSERHCEKQKSYLEWKSDLLKPFIQSKLQFEKGGSHIISGVGCNVQNSYKISSISHSKLTEIYKLFYVGNGNKVIPNNLCDYLNDFVLTVWFMDDGSLVWKNRYYRFDLHTENFSYNEQVIIQEALSKYFTGNILIIPRYYENGIRYYISLRDKQSLCVFLSNLSVYSPDIMKYKFNVSL